MNRQISQSEKNEIAKRLVKISKEFNNKTHQSDELEINPIVNDIKNYPHLFVLACLMDRQIVAKKAWDIPVKVCEGLCDKDYSMKGLIILSLDDLKEFFNREKLHRFNDTMADIFYRAVQRIHNVYDDDASKIWQVGQSSASVVSKFLEFDGCGIKIASMAANLLHRIYVVKYTDYSALDVSPDVHVCRVLYRLGLIEDIGNIDSVIYCARQINPPYPGIIDKCCWNVGRDYCNPSNPKCGQCPLNNICYFIKIK